MQNLLWSPEMSLDVPSMDQAHQCFLDGLMQLSGVPDKEFASRYSAMIADVERDFFEEEQLMDEIDFAASNSHVEQHARVLSALHHANSRVMKGDVAAGRDVIRLLPQWFIFHLSTMDTALAIAYQMAHQPKELAAA